MNRAVSGKFNRFMLWIDAVGGYLVCAGGRAVIGRPVASDERHAAVADIPIFADLAREHATILREGESHLIETYRPVSGRGQPHTGVQVDGVTVRKATALSHGSQLQLGEAVEMTFRLPNPLSASARLDLVSDHSTEPRTSGIVLMADTCLLGPGSDNHIVCRDWTRRIALSWSDGQLFCRELGGAPVKGTPCDALLVNGVAMQGNRAQLLSGARVSGHGISAFTVEAF